MRFAYGNNFVPLEWSPEGYAWTSEYTRGVDQGEPLRHTVIVAHTYTRWLGADVMDWSLPNTVLSVDLSADTLDLKGGGIYFAILIAMPDGRHARYHLRRPLAAPQGAWTTNQWRLQDLKRRDWWCSFASNKQSCKAMPAVPDLCHVEAIEIVMTDGSLPPSGLLKMRNLRVLQ